MLKKCVRSLCAGFCCPGFCLQQRRKRIIRRVEVPAEQGGNIPRNRRFVKQDMIMPPAAFCGFCPFRGKFSESFDLLNQLFR